MTSRPDLRPAPRHPRLAWLRSDTPWVWLTASGVSLALLATVGLILLLAVRGLGHFWPADVVQARYQAPGQPPRLVAGEVAEREQVPRARLLAAGVPVDPAAGEFVERERLKVGNRDLYGNDFDWLVGEWLADPQRPAELSVVERREWGNFYGYVEAVEEDGRRVAEGEGAWDEAQRRIARVGELHASLQTLQRGELARVNAALERLRVQAHAQAGADAAAQAGQAAEQARWTARYQALEARVDALRHDLGRDGLLLRTADGQVLRWPLEKVVRAYRPNAMSVVDKLRFYGVRLKEFVADPPREANTEGGVFPAIFGTVLMTLLMALIVTPFGVVAAVYLHEYARQTLLTRLVRIAVHNLAGVPSIVYGVFGLGFFVYGVGGALDRLFFADALPAPTFGTPGLLWASLTLAILTLPVVIVATEEGLSRIPRSLREGSLALGATQAETLWRIVLPMATPAMLTGLILAVARAAGEVAPLMLVGVVKLAPSLPLDGDWPYLHLDRKIMHLGFQIYDVGFQSPNVEAARPLVYATALLLVLVIALLNLSAVLVRNRLRARFDAS